MFCSFQNVFSQNYIVRLFRFDTVLINILLVEIECKVKVEVLNLQFYLVHLLLYFNSLKILMDIFLKELTVWIMFKGRLPNLDNKK